MDHAVALVEAYLQTNGYLTVAEHPVIRATEEGRFRAATDVDLLGIRLPGAGGVVPARAGEDREREPFRPDPALRVPEGRTDVVICEVKEGAAVLNRGARDPDVLAAVLTRFGCCPPDRVERAVASLMEDGEARLDGVTLRMLGFGSRIDPDLVRAFLPMTLGAAVEWLRDYLRRNWPLLRHAQVKHDALGILALLEQIRRIDGAS